MRQSSAKPADGGSNATGGPAIGVHTSHSASGAGTWAYWIGRPCRARPAQIASGGPSKRSATSRGWPSSRSTVADERPEGEPVARPQRRRRRPVLGARAVVAGAEHDGGKLADVVRRQRAPAGEPHLDGAAARHVLAAQAGGQRRGVVGDHQVAGPQELDERGARGVA